MPVSNTYIEPTASMSLNYARSVYNNSMRALLTNFKSATPPGTTYINIDGVDSGVQDGMLYRSATTNALYIADTLNHKGSSVGSTFTRWGIGHRVEPTVAALTTNLGTYEIGELVVTLDTGKLYVRNSNTAVIGSFVDVGSPTGFSVDAGGNVTFSGQTVTAIKMNVTSNISVGTAAPSESLHVVGGGLVTGTLTSGVSVSNAYNIPATAHVGPSWTTTSPAFHLRNRTFTDNSSAASAVVASRTSVSFFRPTFGSANAAVAVTTPSTIYIEGAPANTSTTLMSNSYAMHIAANGILMSASGSATAPLIALRSTNMGLYAPTTTSISVSTSGALAATFSATGDFTAVGNITAYSDERLKTNIRTIDNALDKVLQMRGVYYDKDGTTSTGVVAQEIEKIFPEVVLEGDFKSVAYGNIVGVLIEAIKELKQELDAFKRGA